MSKSTAPKSTISSEIEPASTEVPLSCMEHIERLAHRGRTYAKLLQVRAGLHMLDQGSRKRANLWLCVEIAGAFPARPVLVPEFIA